MSLKNAKMFKRAKRVKNTKLASYFSRENIAKHGFQKCKMFKNVKFQDLQKSQMCNSKMKNPEVFKNEKS